MWQVQWPGHDQVRHEHTIILTGELSYSRRSWARLARRIVHVCNPLQVGTPKRQQLDGSSANPAKGEGH